MKRLKKNSEAPSDSGAAMVVTLLVMAVLTGVGAIVFNIGLNNMQNAGRDRLAGGALGASEAGVSQALTFVRSNGVGQMKCRFTAPSTWTDCDALWGKNNPKIVPLSGGKEFRVWIQKITPFAPPDFKIGGYMIHSSGTAGKGPGRRDLEVTFAVKPLTFPIGIYADNFTNAGGASVTTVSLLSKVCVNGRKAITFQGIDPYHKIPAAAHSEGVIAAAPNSSCTAADSIHFGLPPPGDEGDCHVDYPDDQDTYGGPLNDPEGLPCFGGLIGGHPENYPQTSFFEDGVAPPDAFEYNSLVEFGYNKQAPRGLTDAEYKQLKSKAQEQNYFFTSVDKCGPGQSPPSCWREPDALADPNAVMYWDLRGAPAQKKQISLQGGDIDGDPNGNPADSLYGGGNKKPGGSGYCGQRSLVIVVDHGNMKVNSGVDIVGAIFVPDGSYTGAGDHNIIGVLFAKVVEKFTGTANFTLTGPTANCFFDNFPGGLLSVVPTKFHEVDR